MDFFKPKKDEPTTLRFTVTPNTYKSKTFSDSDHCPVCSDLDKYTARRGKVADFIKNIGWNDSPLGQAILKSLDDKITELTPKPTPALVAPKTPDIPIHLTEKDFADWKTMTPAQKLAWCRKNLGMHSLLQKIINASAITGGKDNVIVPQSAIIGGQSNTIPAGKVIGLGTHTVAKPADPKPAPTKPEKKGQLTTKFNLTVDYIRQNIMPILDRYSLHEVDAFSALFAKFRSDSEYAVVLTVQDSSIFRMTPEMAVNMVVTLYEQLSLIHI